MIIGRRRHSLFTVRELVVFAMLGALMFALKLAMQALPNIHPVGVLTMVYALVYRAKGLCPLAVYIFLDGLLNGFTIFWLPYTYAFPLLWGITMLLPKEMPDRIGRVVYPVVCALHGLIFGLLNLPAWMLAGMVTWESFPGWMLAALPYDIVHAVSNFCFGFFILPLRDLLQKLNRGVYR